MTLYPLSSYGKVLFFYTCASATLWLCCFGRFIVLLPLVGRKFLPGGMADFFHVVSVLPLLGDLLTIPCTRGPIISPKVIWPVFNSVRMIWLCYGVIFPHPKIAKHTSYSLLIISWTISNFVNSAYYAFKVKTRTSPHFLFWLKHHHFYLTFPVGFTAEMVLVFLSLIFVEEGSWYELVLKVVLLSYIPVGYFFWGHLQSRKKLKYDDFMAKREAGRSNNTTTRAAAAPATTTSTASGNETPSTGN